MTDDNGFPSERAAVREEESFPKFKHRAAAANWDELIWTAGKHTTDEDKTHFEPNYPNSHSHLSHSGVEPGPNKLSL